MSHEFTYINLREKWRYKDRVKQKKEEFVRAWGRKKGKKDEKEKVKIGLRTCFECACKSARIACMGDLTAGCVFFFFF